MCQTVEDYAAEKVKQIEIQIASNCLKNGIPVDIVAKSIPSLSHSKRQMQPYIGGYRFLSRDRHTFDISGCKI